MTDNFIVRVGQALYGDTWQAQMARDLQCSKDTVQDWRQGRYTPRPGVFVDLMRIASERASEIDQLIEELKAMGG